CASTSTAPASRSNASGLGKTPTTSVRRFTSLFNRSSVFVLQIFFQCAAGKPVNANRSSAASRSIASTFVDWRPSIPAITPSCSRTCAASGWAKIVRIAAATISAEPFGTCASTLRRKCDCKESMWPCRGIGGGWDGVEEVGRAGEPDGRGGGRESVLVQDRAEFAHDVTDGAPADLEQFGEGVLGAQFALVEHRCEDTLGVGDLLGEH